MFVSGTDDEKAFGVGLDTNDNIFIGALTNSNDFPTTDSTCDSTFEGYRDVVVAKLKFDTTTIISNILNPINLHSHIKTFPNPFTNQISFSFNLAKANLVKLMIFNSTGQKVSMLYTKYQDEGEVIINWK